MSQDYNYDYEWDARYCYPQSNVLINKLGITDAGHLHEAEREITSLRISRAKVQPIQGTFDLKHLMAIHRYIFGDIYAWAGEIRWVNISKGNVFCQAQYIEQNANELFTKLKHESYLGTVSPNEIPLRLAHYLGEINVIHPFREGNGRAQRLFIEYLAQRNGYTVDFSTVTDKEMIEASALAFGCDYTKLNALMMRITVPALSPEQVQEQQML